MSGRVASGSARASRSWLFTLNDIPQDSDLAKAAARQLVEALQPQVRWAIFQLEKGGQELRYHLQGYVYLAAPRPLSTLRSLIVGAHWEQRRGSHAQARDYCSKADTRVEGPFVVNPEGEPQSGASGRANQTALLYEKLKAGVTERELALSEETFPMWKNNFRVIERWHRLNQANLRNWPVYTTVYWGPSGTGKTRRALFESGPDAFWLSKPEGSGSLWFDGYDGQENVVIDEFYGWIKLDTLLRMLDRYPLLVQTKGGTTTFLAKRVWITSNQDPDLWYRNVSPNGMPPALARRLSAPLGTIVAMDQSWEPPMPSEDEAEADRDAIFNEVARELVSSHSVVSHVSEDEGSNEELSARLGYERQLRRRIEVMAPSNETLDLSDVSVHSVAIASEASVVVSLPDQVRVVTDSVSAE